MSINLTQHFLFETDSLVSFRRVLNTMVRIMYEEKPSQYAQLFITKKTNPLEDKGKFLYVCSVGDYRSNITDGDETFDSYPKLIRRVMEHLKKADKRKFFEECGSGYNDWFNSFDGSVEVGYRINKSPLGGWEFLDISLCHIYYGK